jgi:hypothetical protein
MEKASQSPDQFEAREAVRFERDKVKKIQVTAEKGKWTAEKQGNQWKVTNPSGKDKKTFADYRVFLALEDLRGDKVLKPGSVALTSPLVVCELTLQGSTIRVEIFKKENDWYARSSQSDKIFKISESRSQSLNQPIDNFLE